MLGIARFALWLASGRSPKEDLHPDSFDREGWAGPRRQPRHRLSVSAKPDDIDVGNRQRRGHGMQAGSARKRGRS